MLMYLVFTTSIHLHFVFLNILWLLLIGYVTIPLFRTFNIRYAYYRFIQLEQHIYYKNVFTEMFKLDFDKHQLPAVSL